MRRPRLLIVEDQRIIARDLARRLTTRGYTVLACVGSGREAVTHAAALRPDLVRMDVGLPGGMDGLAAAAQIRVQGNIPIIYLTGSSAAVLDPASVTIQKPFNDQALHQTIQLALTPVAS